MTFLQIHTFYTSYLSRFYAERPHLFGAAYGEHIGELRADGFGAAHMWAPVLGELGHKTQLIIANNVVGQCRWAEEKPGQRELDRPAEWMREIALKQVNQFDPEVLYLGDPVSFDMSFVRRLKRRPHWVVGWRAAPTPDTVDWRGMDLLLSHLDASQRFARRKGVKDVRFFYPGFPRWVAEAVFQEPIEYDVVFCGQWSDHHVHRNQYLTKVAEASLRPEKSFRFGLFLECAEPDKLPEAVRKLNQGGRWGLAMYRTLRRGNIALNAEINMGRGNAGNMRLFEATGTGVCTLTEHHDDIGRYFEPGREIATFKSSDDMLRKIDHYLSHVAEREAMAKAGQERCLTEHALENRMKQLEALLTEKSRGVGHWLSKAWHRVRP